MPTPRKRYFRVADAILREPWPRDVKLMLVLLMAWLNQRWARDGLSADEAGRAILSRSALAEITGRYRLDSARKALRKLADHVSITIEVDGDFTSIRWPKFAEFQNYPAETGPSPGLEAAPSVPPPRPRPATRDPQRERPGSAVPRSCPVVVFGERCRPEDLVHLLGRKPGTQEEKLRWLEGELPKIERDARAAFPKDDPSPAALRAKTEKLVFAYWERRNRSAFTPVLPANDAEVEEKAEPPSDEDLAAMRVCHKLRKKMAPRFPTTEDYAVALEAAGMMEAAQGMRGSAATL